MDFNESSFTNWTNIKSPFECYKLRYIGIYCMVIFWISFISNSTYLWTIFRNRSILTPINLLICVWIAFSLLGTLLGLPILTLSALNCGYIFGKIGCYFEGFSMYFLGCFGINVVTIISIIRYLVIFRPRLIIHVTYSFSVKAIIVCILLSAFWPVVPLFGWSNYSLEGVLINCSVEWRIRSFNVISYNVTIFLFAFIIPLCILIYTNVKLVQMIKLPSGTFENNQKNKEIKVRREKRLTKVTIAIIAAHMVAWLPYSIVTMLIAFTNLSITPFQATSATLFAKLSFVWPSLLSIISSKDIRKRILLTKEDKSLMENSISGHNLKQALSKKNTFDKYEALKMYNMNQSGSD